MQFGWSDFLGALGTTLIIATYILLQIRRIRSESLLYSILNAAGASLILFSLAFNFNLSAFIVEFFWLLISLFGVGRYFLKK